VPAQRVLSQERAVRAAERMFHAHAQVDMHALAAELGASRATLYRVAGSRERLLGDVLWWQGSRLMERCAAEVTGSGAERMVQLAKTFNTQLVGYEPLRRFLREQVLLAHHVLFLPEARVHSRFVRLWRDLFSAAAERGELVLPFDVDELAYVWVRTGESMLYADLMSGLEPKVELAERVQRLLLQPA
jgi:AcrR family transcriptional regulator